ncbi:zinc ABC transporter substrate-binding protein [Porticoccus sp.]
MKTIRLSWLIALLWVAPAPWVLAATDNEVVVSIKPLAMLVKAVAGENWPVRVLMPANVSPHDYALRFSDVRALNEAALVIWVGPELESALRKPLEAQAATTLQLSALPELTWPTPADADPEHDSTAEPGKRHEETDSEHMHTRDPHLWLNPENGRVMATAIAARLSALYPQQSALFAQNLANFVAGVDNLDRRARQRLAPLQGRGFVVTHDGYGHFVRYYGLNQLAAVQLASGHQQGARHFGEILGLGARVSCVFTEPQLNSKAARQLAVQLGARMVELDPMGQQVALGAGSYLEFLGTVVDAFATCLAD